MIIVSEWKGLNYSPKKANFSLKCEIVYTNYQDEKQGSALYDIYHNHLLKDISNYNAESVNLAS